MQLIHLASTIFLFLLGKESRNRKCVRCRGLPELTTTVLPSDKYDALLDWLQSKDAEISSKIEIKLSSRGGGYGAFVTESIDEEELLFTIPRSACISLSDAISDPSCGDAFKKLMEKAGPGGNTVVMAGYMAKEWLKSLEHTKEESDVTDSSFGPYLSTLPWERGINSQEHILYWSDEDIEKYLKGSMCYGEAKDLRSEVELAIKVLNSVVGQPTREIRGEMIEESGFKWPWEVKVEKAQGMVEGLPEAVKGAFVAVLTRSFQDEGSDEEIMEPLLDMLQHSDEPNVSHKMRKADGTIEVRARKGIEAGEELLNQYRSEREENMPYHRFFTLFGFVPGIQEPIQNLLEDNSSIFFAQKAEV